MNNETQIVFPCVLQKYILMIQWLGSEDLSTKIIKYLQLMNRKDTIEFRQLTITNILINHRIIWNGILREIHLTYFLKKYKLKISGAESQWDSDNIFWANGHLGDAHNLIDRMGRHYELKIIDNNLRGQPDIFCRRLGIGISRYGWRASTNL